MMNRNEAASILAFHEYKIVDAATDLAPKWAGCFFRSHDFCDCADCATSAIEDLKWAIDFAYDCDDGAKRAAAARRQPAPARALTGRIINLEFEDITNGGGRYWTDCYEGEIDHKIWSMLCAGYGLSDMD